MHMMTFSQLYQLGLMRSLWALFEGTVYFFVEHTALVLLVRNILWLLYITLVSRD